MRSAQKSALGSDNEGRNERRRKSYIMFTAWSPLVRALSDEAAGKLFKAICDYQDGNPVTFEDQTLNAVFALFVAAFSENAEKYERVCARNAVNGLKGGRPKKARASPQEEKTEPRTQDQAADTISSAALSEPVQEKLREWMVYKSEKKQSYKPQGLKALLSRAEKAEEAHGAAAVVGLIEDAMSSGYQGIIWEKLERASPGNSRPGQQRGTVKQNQFTAGVENNSYDFDALERDLLAN